MGKNVTFSGGFAIQQDFAWPTGIDPSSVVKNSHNMELYFEVDEFDELLHLVDIWEEEMKILLYCAKGFEMMELSPFIDVLGWARNDFGHEIEVELCGFCKEVVSTFQVKVGVDILINDVKIEDYEALVIPGGFEEYGFYEEAYHPMLLDLIRGFEQAGKIIASVCVGALPIGKSGILIDRNATTYHLRDGYRQKQLSEFGAIIREEPIVIDQNIITSYCPQTAPYVAFKLLERLIGSEETQKVKIAMGF